MEAGFIIPSKGLVSGDIILLQAGVVITPDLQIITASKLHADEFVPP